MYFNNSIKTLSRSDKWDKKIDKHYYDAMVKVGEKYTMTFEEVKMFITASFEPGDRQRLIFCPQGEAGNGLLTMMLRPLLLVIKREMPGFCHSVSCTEMATNIQNNHRKIKGKDIVAVCCDGSNHDGHQHWDLLKIVDVYFFKKLFKKGWLSATLKNYTYNEECVRSVIDQPLFEKISKLKVRFDKQKRAILKIKGTTYSGSCSRTTLGNTLRVFLYWAYICDNLNLKVLTWEDDKQADVFLYVSGDDSVLWTSRKNAILIKDNYLRWMSPNKNEQKHGLGQCVTEFSIRERYDIDFCSKIGALSPKGKMVILRNPKKIFTHSNFHRYMSDTAYMPHYLHSEYVGESILHELPGLLCKSYGKMRRDKGLKIKQQRSRKKTLGDYIRALDVRRKMYNV